MCLAPLRSLHRMTVTLTFDSWIYFEPKYPGPKWPRTNVVRPGWSADLESVFLRHPSHLIQSSPQHHQHNIVVIVLVNVTNNKASSVHHQSNSPARRIASPYWFFQAYLLTLTIVEWGVWRSMLSVSLCMSVCLSVCSHFTDKTAEDMSTELGGWLILGDSYITIFKVKGQTSRSQGQKDRRG